MAHALIVDDDPDVVEWLQEVARMEGFTIARAHSLRERFAVAWLGPIA